MFRKSIEGIIAEGVKNLQSQAERVARRGVEAQEEVTRCAEQVKALIRLAQEVPEKVFDRYSSVMITTMDMRTDQPAGYLSIRTNNGDWQLHGVMGPEAIKAGKYRAIVLLEPLT